MGRIFTQDLQKMEKILGLTAPIPFSKVGASMISGIGIDIIEIERFQKLLKEGKTRFLFNTFTDEEQGYCLAYEDSATHFAGTFAAKEAIQKATGQFSLLLNQISIHRADSGKPEVLIKGQRDPSILVSITHNGSSACAVAIKQSV